MLVLAFSSMVMVSIARAQAPVDYSDVGLIVNDNSDSSKAIGAYFAAKRHIAARNIIHISVPATEQIDSLTFISLRKQVETYLIQTKLKDSLNYLVTTKGMPLGVYRSGSNASSVESDLMLILGVDSSQIGKNGWYQQNYGGKREHFTRAKYHFYLITRLDGYTNAGIFRMIDSSGPNTFVDQSKAQFILDEDPTPIDGNYNLFMQQVAPILATRGWNVVLNADSVYLTHEQNVIGYVSWGSNDDHFWRYSTHANPMNTWLPGSIAETYVSTGGRSFQPGTGYGQSLVADWLQEGVSGIKGYVYEPYTAALAQVQVLFERYTDTSQDMPFNMAESYVMASPLASWMDVIVGDPKMSIITHIPPQPNPTASAPSTVCKGDNISLAASDSLHGRRNWFKGSAAQVRAIGPPYDSRNAQWLKAGTAATVAATNTGTFTYCYCDENISGAGFAEVTVTVLARPTVTIGLPSDTIAPSDSISFGVTASNVTHWSWNFGDSSAMDTIEKPQHRYAATGSYQVRLTLSNGVCDTVITGNIVVQAKADVLAIAQSVTRVSLSPNPSNGEFKLHVESIAHDRPSTQAISYHVFDITGRDILFKELPASPQYDETLSIGNAPAGVYLLEVRAGGNCVREKMIKR